LLINVVSYYWSMTVSESHLSSELLNSVWLWDSTSMSRTYFSIN
jgi:hypothetical protein